VIQRGVLVFDMDGVLVNVSESYREAIVQTVKHFTGKEVPRALIQEYKNAGGYNNDWKLSHKITEDLGVCVAYDEVVDYFNRIFLDSGESSLIYRERWIAEAGLFERLARRYDFAILTGRLRAEANITLNRYAAGIRFHPVVCHDDVQRSKPDPEGLFQVAVHYPGRKLWYVGDTVDDARCAKAAGVTFVGIAPLDAPDPPKLAALLKAEGAVAVLSDINQLESVL